MKAHTVRVAVPVVVLVPQQEIALTDVVKHLVTRGILTFLCDFSMLTCSTVCRTERSPTLW